MAANARDIITVLAVAGLAGLGGALAVFAGYDDSPGGVMIGFVLMLGSVVLGIRAAAKVRS